MARTRVAAADATPLFLLYAGLHALLVLVQCRIVGVSSAGSLIVVLIAVALVWDNGLIGCGRRICNKDASSSSREFRRLAMLSQPRFIAHAVLTPFLAVSALELGERAGVSWVTTTSVWRVCSGLSLIGLVHHLLHPRLTLRHAHPKEPKGSWMRPVVSMTIASLADDAAATTAAQKGITLALMIGPAVLVCVFTLAIGASIVQLPTATPASLAAGRWLWICSLIELLSNAGPPWTMAITGNAGEVVLLAGFVAADWLLY